MKGKFSALVFTLLTFWVQAQNATLQGRITDEKNEGLIQAAVVIDASKAGMSTISDFDGNYELSIPAGTYTVTFRYVGKEEQKVQITVAAGEKVTKNITLTERQKMMDQVVVTGSKYAKKLSEETVSLEVMKGNVLQNQNVTDVSNGVQKIPGVTIADGQANIRGGSGWSYGAGSRVAVLYDDLPITTADADDAKWSIVPVEQIEQLEVLKGASSVIYGTGALNGVINARSTDPTDKPWTRLQTYGGFYEGPTKTRTMKWWNGRPQYFLGANFGDRRRVGQFDITTGIAYTNDRTWQADYNTFATASNPGNTNDTSANKLVSAGNQDLRVNFKVKYRFKGLLDGLNVGVGAIAYWSWGKTFFLWDNIGPKGYIALANTVTTYENSRYIVDPFITYYKNNNKIDLRYRWLGSSNVNNTGQGSLADRHIINATFQRPFDVNEKVKINFIAGVGGRIDKVRPPTNPLDTTSDARRQRIKDSLGYYPIPYLYGDRAHNAYNASVFAQVDMKFFNRLNVVAGARYEYFDVDGRNSLNDLKYPLFRFGVNYQAAKATYIRGSFGQGFRYPSIAELYVTTSLGSISIFPNTKLKPEKGYSAELGIKQGYQFGKTAVVRGYADLAGFWNQYQNMMEFMFGQFNPASPLPGFSSQNVGSTRILGVDFALANQISYKDFEFNFLVGYTFINAVSLNWNDKLTLFDTKGDTLKPYYWPFGGVGTQTTNNANAPKDLDTLKYFTYGMTSSSKENTLKYRPKHQVKIILSMSYKKFDLNLDYQFISYQRNIDYAFVSPFFTQLVPLALGINSFTGLKTYRDGQEAKGITGDHILNISVGYKPVDKLKLAFICKNVTNAEWMPRPGRFEAPRNYTLQVTYTF
ncbi:MAG: TonB-dependent receptor [Chitinophagales bacterium]